MAKLVVLSVGMTGRTQELKVDKTTIGRVEDNTFQIAEPSVSSHHCEVLLKGSDVVVRDLNSTNGTLLNEEKLAMPTVVISEDEFLCGKTRFIISLTGDILSPPP